jgi:hypothetical protein
MSTTAGFNIASEMNPGLVATVLSQIEIGPSAGIALPNLGVSGADTLLLPFPTSGQDITVTILPNSSTVPQLKLRRLSPAVTQAISR